MTLKYIKNIVLLTIFIATSLLANTQQEINHLLNYVKTTECMYERNGDLHKGSAAVKHIQKKYDYFKDDINSAEDFIRLSASESTFSGNKYHILCPDKKSENSQEWLLRELNNYRLTNANKTK